MWQLRRSPPYAIAPSGRRMTYAGHSAVDIWTWSLDDWGGNEMSGLSILSDDEKERASRFVKPQDARRYVVGRAAMRGILGQYVGSAPAALSFSYNAQGKPELAAPGRRDPVRFNLSHSAGQAVLAVSRGFELGVDIEEVRTFEEDVAGHFFSKAECAQLQSLPPGDRTLAFFRGWTRKEAFVKATGLGLSLALDSFDVSLIDDQQPMLRRMDPSIGSIEDWVLLGLDVPSGFCGAVAVLSRGARVEICYRGDPGNRPGNTSMT